jgi:hypothetical protein
LTKDKILSMVPGPEMDAFVEEIIFGKRWVKHKEVIINETIRKVETWIPDWGSPNHPPAGTFAGQTPPERSTDISAAFEVVEKMMSLGYRYVMRGNYEGNGLHWVGFDLQEWADCNPPWQSPIVKSLPEAICKASLIAVMNK